MVPPILLTGATGFLGMQVLDRILEETDRPVLACVRATDAVSAQRRVAGTLETLYGSSDRHPGRVRAIPADITLPAFGLDPAAWSRLAHECGAIVHCAASVSFGLELAEARAINVGGTLQVLALARRARAEGALERFVHVSTAYVAGDTEGLFTEAHRDVGQGFRNTYERTKLEAELAVAGALDELGGVVVRPSIVVGERASGWTASFNVVYPPLRAFSAGSIEVVPGRPEGIVDIVPVDYVADAIAQVLLRRTDVGGTLHLVAGRHATTIGALAGMAAARLGRPAPRFGPAPEGFGRLVPYFDVAARFDDARARTVLAPAGITPSPVAEYFDVLIDYAEEAGWGRRALTRRSARERLERAVA
jgi:nucleoside-diphosphate-sugar epimerase